MNLIFAGKLAHNFPPIPFPPILSENKTLPTKNLISIIPFIDFTFLCARPSDSLTPPPSSSLAIQRSPPPSLPRDPPIHSLSCFLSLPPSLPPSIHCTPLRAINSFANSAPPFPRIRRRAVRRRCLKCFANRLFFVPPLNLQAYRSSFRPRICRRSSRLIMFDALFRRNNASGPTTTTCSNSRICDGSKRRRFFQRNFVRTGLLGFLGCGVLCYWNSERVPFTNRSHVLLFSTSFEKFLFERIVETSYKGKVLPPLHPSSIRVRRIGQEILEAAEKGLRKTECSIPQFDWEFLVVDEPIANAECLCGSGKILSFTGLLDKSDAEIAVRIGHEVGHAIARHGAECHSKLAISNSFLFWSINFHLLPAISKLSKKLLEGQLPKRSVNLAIARRCAIMCRASIMLILYSTANIFLIPAISQFLIGLPTARRSEKEADYIGLILIALAGYDPRVSVEAMEKLIKEVEHVIGCSFLEYVSSHPSIKKRLQLISQPKVMEEALSLYEEALRQQRSASQVDKPQGGT